MLLGSPVSQTWGTPETPDPAVGSAWGPLDQRPAVCRRRSGHQSGTSRLRPQLSASPPGTGGACFFAAAPSRRSWAALLGGSGLFLGWALSAMLPGLRNGTVPWGRKPASGGVGPWEDTQQAKAGGRRHTHAFGRACSEGSPGAGLLCALEKAPALSGSPGLLLTRGLQGQSSPKTAGKKRSWSNPPHSETIRQ